VIRTGENFALTVSMVSLATETVKTVRSKRLVLLPPG
jgi:hypothetical protein